MKKKTAIVFIILSLCLSLLIVLRVRLVDDVRSWESKLLGTLIVLAAIAMLYLAYKSLLKRFAKGSLKKEDYALLYDLENKAHSGEIEFYFTIEQPKAVSLLILNEQMQDVTLVVEKEYTTGGHIVRFDTNQLPNGVYFYCLKTSNQKTMKKLFVYHDNVAV